MVAGAVVDRRCAVAARAWTRSGRGGWQPLSTLANCAEQRLRARHVVRVIDVHPAEPAGVQVRGRGTGLAEQAIENALVLEAAALASEQPVHEREQPRERA